jgi:glutathione S-transferase
MITLYGSARSRASRSLLALEELGLPYEHVPLRPWEGPSEQAALQALNPNGRVPVLRDGALVVWESIAINLYLGDRYRGPLWPGDVADRARLYQWSLWSQTSVDVMARHRARLGVDSAARARAEAERLAALTLLDQALADHRYLLGDAFTLADINVAATLIEPWENGLVDGDLDPAAHGLPALADWLARCVGRPSWNGVRDLP